MADWGNMKLRLREAHKIVLVDAYCAQEAAKRGIPEPEMRTRATDRIKEHADYRAMQKEIRAEKHKLRIKK